LTNFFLLNSDHNRKNPCVSFKNQPTYASNNRKFMKGDPYLNLVLVMLHHIFADATKVWLCKSKS
jgi:hypothetical protein